MAKHNAAIYGVADRIEFIVGDFLQLSDSLRADVVFLSPPWGGPGYSKKVHHYLATANWPPSNAPLVPHPQNRVFDVETDLLPVSATELVQKARQVSPNIALFLPRNCNSLQVMQLARLFEPGAQHSEIEQNFLERKFVGITAYFGELAALEPAAATAATVVSGAPVQK